MVFIWGACGPGENVVKGSGGSLVALVMEPVKAAPFVLGMLAGMAAFEMTERARSR